MLKHFKSAWAYGSSDNIGLIAAGIAYYSFLAMIPLIAASVLSYGLFTDAETISNHIAAIANTLPPTAAELIIDQLRAVSDGPKTTQSLGLVGSLALALFGARNGAGSVITGLNVAYNVSSSRGFLKYNALALLLTVGALAAMGLVSLAIAATSGLTGVAGSVASFALICGAGTGGAMLAYQIAPNRPREEWLRVMPGAILFGTGWTLASSAFSYYAANFGDYGATYGSLSAIIVLLTWLYLSAFLLLLGAELNVSFERKAAQ